jgi:hypothetical protein
VERTGPIGSVRIRCLQHIKGSGTSLEVKRALRTALFDRRCSINFFGPTNFEFERDPQVG